MAAARFAPPGLCKVYNLNVDELLQQKQKFEGFLESLGSIGVTVEHLGRMAMNCRHQLVVLLGPTDTWNPEGPTVYCAIQVCLEGAIAGMPELEENDPFKREIKKTFIMFPQLPRDSLVGVRIVQVFLIPGVQVEQYRLTALGLLTRYFNGDVAQQLTGEVPEREDEILSWLDSKQERVHYLGTFTNPTSSDVGNWERAGLNLFYIGFVQAEEDNIACVMLLPLADYDIDINGAHQYCSRQELFKAFGGIFESLISSWRDFDRPLALRILSENLTLRSLLGQGGRAAPPRKPWAGESAEKRIEAFIHSDRNIELVTDLVTGVARSYFRGELPVILSEEGQSVLLLVGLQGFRSKEAQEAMNVDETCIFAFIRDVFVTVLDYFNTKSPEVVD